MLIVTFVNHELGLSIRQKLNALVASVGVARAAIDELTAVEATVSGKSISGATNTVTELLLSALAAGVVDANPTLAANSSARVATQRAVRAFVASVLDGPGSALTFAGVLDASAGPDYPAASLGQTYKVSVGGKVGGPSGADVGHGDLLICIVAAAGGDHETVGDRWVVVRTNADGRVIGPPSSTASRFARFADAVGRELADAGPLVAADITDAGAAGRALLTAGTVTAQRAMLGITGGE